MDSIIGSTLYANYGAMSPVYELTVKCVNKDGLLVCEGDMDLGRIFIESHSIRDKRPESGSPIGIYFNEEDAY